MPRKGPAPKRELKPDEIFGSRLVTRFINKILQGGRKSAAEKIFYVAMQLIGERMGENPLVVLRNAMRNVMPNLEVRPRRVGGATYQVPGAVDTRRQLTLAVRWIIGVIRINNNPRVEVGLAAVIVVAVVSALVPYSIGLHLNDYRPYAYSTWQATNWAWTILMVANGLDLSAMIGLISVIAAAAFLVTLLASPQLTMPRRIATPERVQEELDAANTAP